MPGTKHGSQEPYSELESVPIDPNAKEVVPSEVKEVAPSETNVKEVVPTEQKANPQPQFHSAPLNNGIDRPELPESPQKRTRFYHRRKWTLWGCLIGIVVVVVVLGGTLGTLLHQSNHSQPSAENG